MSAKCQKRTSLHQSTKRIAFTALTHLSPPPGSKLYFESDQFNG
jgi:hypothetical protein